MEHLGSGLQSVGLGVSSTYRSMRVLRRLLVLRLNPEGKLLGRALGLESSIQNVSRMVQNT